MRTSKLQRVLVLGLVSVLSVTALPNTRVDAASETPTIAVEVNQGKTKTITVGESATLKITGTTKEASWYISAEGNTNQGTSVATLSNETASSVQVDAKEAGICYLHAKVENEDYICEIRAVEPLQVNGGEEKTVRVGETAAFQVTGATRDVKWFVSSKENYNEKTEVAEVSGKEGTTLTVTAKKAGICYVSAKVGNEYVSCKLTVKAPIVLNGEKTAAVRSGSSVTLKLTGTDKDSEVKWYISSKKDTNKKTENAVISKKGERSVRISAKKAGTCYVRAEVEGKFYTCKITVKPEIVLNDKKSVSLTEGESASLRITGAEKETVKWYISSKSDSNADTKVAAIADGTSQSVQVTAKKAGTCYVRAVIGKESYSCKITVKALPVIEKAVQTVQSGQTQKKAESYSNDDLYLLSHLIGGEVGANWCTEEQMLAVGSVVLNRVNDPRFPNTLKGVIFQSGQYACTWDGNFDREPTARVVRVAQYLLDNGSVIPTNVVWQSSVPQGNGVYKTLITAFGYPIVLCY